MSEPTVYLNGEYLPLSQARVPVHDRGFIFGDGVYEVVPVYGGRLFRWPEHLARLERSLGRLRITNPLSAEAWLALVRELVRRHPWPDQFVYLHVTRGVSRRDHGFPKEPVAPTVFAQTSELKLPDPALRASGVSLISLPDERWGHCDIKSISLLGNVLARQAAVDAGAFECVQFRDGFMTEGSSSNFWVVRDGCVYGAPLDHRVLAGIRVGLIEELCAELEIPFHLQPILREQVHEADELLLSSATKEILPATRLDDRPIGDGRPGPVYARLHEAYQRAKARHVL